LLLCTTTYSQHSAPCSANLESSASGSKLKFHVPQKSEMEIMIFKGFIEGEDSITYDCKLLLCS